MQHHVLAASAAGTPCGQQAANAKSKSLALTPSLNALAAKERCLALEVHGRRYDIGLKYGLLTAQVALALGGKDREETLAILVELLAQRGD